MALKDNICCEGCLLHNGQPSEWLYRIDVDAIEDIYTDEIGFDIDALIYELRQTAEELEDNILRRDLAHAMRIIANELEDSGKLPAYVTLEIGREEE